MEENQIKDKLLDFIEGGLPPHEQAEIQQAIEKNATIFRAYDELRTLVESMDKSPTLQPTPEIAANFYQELENLKSEERHFKQMGKLGVTYNNFRKTWNQSLLLRIAVAASLFLLGFFIDKQIEVKEVQNAEIQALRQEMTQTKNMVMLTMIKQESASQRIKAINYSYQMHELDSQIVAALIHTMNFDRNSNVRLAACEALIEFSNESNIKAEMIRSLPNQNDPNVQLTILSMIEHEQDKNAVDPIRKLLKNEALIEAVRNKAQENLGKLL